MDKSTIAETNGLKDTWVSGDVYEQFMGRWSRLVSGLFIDWLSKPFRLKWLDVGCGSGALSEIVLARLEPAALTAMDQSGDFVATARKRLGSRAMCVVGNALALPLQDSSVDVTVSGLVLNFVPSPERALAEMIRVTARGGTVAVYVWDYAGRMDFLNFFWDAAIELTPGDLGLHEGKRFHDSNADTLGKLFLDAGLALVEIAPIDIRTHFRDFDDYWLPFLGGQGPAPTYLQSLGESERSRLREVLHQRLPIQADGSISLNARAWAAKGRVK